MNKRIAAVTATACMLFASVMIPAVSAEGTTDIGAQNQVKAVAYSDALDKLDYKGIRVGGLSGLTWDKTADSYVAQSDNHGSDESRVWFLGKDLHNPSITRDPVTFTDVNGTPYNGNTTDNEGIAVLPTAISPSARKAFPLRARIRPNTRQSGSSTPVDARQTGGFPHGTGTEHLRYRPRFRRFPVRPATFMEQRDPATRWRSRTSPG